jgi:transcriptional regulator with XRE-family HTH domain
MGTATNFLFATQVHDLGHLARLARIARRLRQSDVAALARVRPEAISAFERGGYVHPVARERILAALGIGSDTEASSWAARQEAAAP